MFIIDYVLLVRWFCLLSCFFSPLFSDHMIIHIECPSQKLCIYVGPVEINFIKIKLGVNSVNHIVFWMLLMATNGHFTSCRRTPFFVILHIRRYYVLLH